MAKTPHQRAIIKYASENGNRITKKEAVYEIGGGYYCHAEKHVGDVLSRMVKAGMLIREKPGVFVLGKGKRENPTKEINQPTIF